jgi:hypothetical protein
MKLKRKEKTKTSSFEKYLVRLQLLKTAYPDSSEVVEKANASWMAPDPVWYWLKKIKATEKRISTRSRDNPPNLCNTAMVTFVIELCLVLAPTLSSPLTKIR